MQEMKLLNLYNQCIQELNSIGINIQNNEEIGNINIKISNRANKRYGCCKQEKPDLKYKVIIKQGHRRIIRYEKFKNHNIEISNWVMQLDEKIIKNTIIHELIHCIPFCNNHGKEFKKYASYINQKLGYNIRAKGNKEQDYKTSKLEYLEANEYKYKIVCKSCGQIFYRKRINTNFVKKYCCGKCKGRLQIIDEI